MVTRFLEWRLDTWNGDRIPGMVTGYLEWRPDTWNVDWIPGMVTGFLEWWLDTWNGGTDVLIPGDPQTPGRGQREGGPVYILTTR